MQINFFPLVGIHTLVTCYIYRTTIKCNACVKQYTYEYRLVPTLISQSKRIFNSLEFSLNMLMCQWWDTNKTCSFRRLARTASVLPYPYLRKDSLISVAETGADSAMTLVKMTFASC